MFSMGEWKKKETPLYIVILGKEENAVRTQCQCNTVTDNPIRGICIIYLSFTTLEFDGVHAQNLKMALDIPLYFSLAQSFSLG